MSSGIVETGSSKDPNREKRPDTQQVPRARLVQKLMAAGADLPAFITALIETQGIVVAGTEAAAFIVEPGDAQPQAPAIEGETTPAPPPQANFKLRAIAHVRPDDSDPDTRQRALEEFAKIVRPCVEQGKDGVIEVDASRRETVDPQFCLVTLLRAEGQVVAVSAVIARAPNGQRAQQRLSSMELVAGYFEMFTLKRAAEQTRAIAATNQNVLQLATAVATAEGYDAASMSLCNELAARTGATRVAIGWLEGRKIKLKAMSHTEKFDKKQELAVMIIAAMEECLDQEELVQYEPDGASSDNVTRASAELSRTQGGVSVLSLPLRRIGDMVGVVTLEFNAQKKLGPNAATGLAVAVELLAPQLYDRYQNDRWWITKTGISLRETYKMAVGPKHMLAKLIIAVSVIGLAFVTLYKPMYHVTAPFQFSSTESRIVSSPMEGYISDVVNVKPGDHVKAGDILLEMDVSQLRLQQLEKESTANAKAMQSRAAAADPTKTAESRQFAEEANAARFEAEYYQSLIDQAKVKAPIDGVVMSGDWLDKRRSPVRKGDELFKIADPKKLRVEMNVAERDIQLLKDDGSQKGWLATSSLPGEKMPFVVTQRIPLGTPDQGANIFKVYGRPTEFNPQWRDGMQGEARVEIEKRRLGWIWTHRLVEWVQLKTWWF
ncbi:hypothetical protein BH09PLA1_BH09PLA1_11790 [soil metagenome]